MLNSFRRHRACLPRKRGAEPDNWKVPLCMERSAFRTRRPFVCGDQNPSRFAFLRHFLRFFAFALPRNFFLHFALAIAG
jgi:hypothetical protein